MLRSDPIASDAIASDVLVWVGGYLTYGWWRPWGGPIAGGAIVGAGIMFCPMSCFGGGQLLAYDVSQSAEPKFLWEVNLATNGWWNFSQPVGSGTAIYLSHQAPEISPAGFWLQRSYLDVIDYADPVSPSVRKPVNIPGTLQGVSDAGELLYTTGYHWGTNAVWTGPEWLDASAYDGVTAHLVDSLALPDTWPHPVLVSDKNIFIGSPSSTYDPMTSQLETWTLPDTGKFTRLGSVKLNMPASALLAHNRLLAVGQTDRAVWAVRPSQPRFPGVDRARKPSRLSLLRPGPSRRQRPDRPVDPARHLRRGQDRLGPMS